MISISDIFEWIGEAASGGLDILVTLASGVENLFITPGVGEGSYKPSLIGLLVIAGVGAPLAWKFIKYIVSLFKKVKPN